MLLQAEKMTVQKSNLASNYEWIEHLEDKVLVTFFLE